MKQIPFTKVGFEKMLKEYEELKASRPDAVMHLKRARELGDLSENGYYKASRAKLSFIDSRLRHLKSLINQGLIVEQHASNIVEIGMNITIDDGKDKRTFQLVGGYESNPSEGRISHISPLGKALLGARVGDKKKVATPQGEKEYTILALSP